MSGISHCSTAAQWMLCIWLPYHFLCCVCVEMFMRLGLNAFELLHFVALNHSFHIYSCLTSHALSVTSANPKWVFFYFFTLESCTALLLHCVFICFSTGPISFANANGLSARRWKSPTFFFFFFVTFLPLPSIKHFNRTILCSGTIIFPSFLLESWRVVSVICTAYVQISASSP